MSEYLECCLLGSNVGKNIYTSLVEGFNFLKNLESTSNFQV